MVNVLHIIHHASAGGATRGCLATAKYSSDIGYYQHKLVSLHKLEDNGRRLAAQYNIPIIDAPDKEELMEEIQKADIVQIQYWNTPEIMQILSEELPETRLILWYHISGDGLPQIITDNHINFADINIASNPFTYKHLPAFQKIPAEKQGIISKMVYDAADFKRLENIKLKEHNGFNVGYIGMVDFIKMHPNFVPMSANVNIPDVKFIVCGHGIENQLIEQARSLGAENKFDFRGYVEDISRAIEIFDVYGYPLTEDTYASGELNLQEVMYAGVPPIVFPYGGVKLLIENEKTGLIVHSEKEYTEAIEYLYNNPETRRKLGQNAKEYAKAHFGAENAARQLNLVYEEIIKQPKRKRKWGSNVHTSLLDQPISLKDISDKYAQLSGSEVFCNSINSYGKHFRISKESNDILELIKADNKIAQSSQLTFISGVLPYRQHSDDPFFNFWLALILLQKGEFGQAANEFKKAIDSGFRHWRIYWYMAQALQKIGHPEANNILSQLKAQIPQIEQIFSHAASLAAQDIIEKTTDNQENFVESIQKDHFSESININNDNEEKLKKSTVDSALITVATSLELDNIEKQQQAIKSWLGYGFKIISVNTIDQINQLKVSFPDVEFIETENNSMHSTGKPNVFMMDLLNALRSTSSKIVGIIEPHIVLNDIVNLVEQIENFTESGIITGSQIDSGTDGIDFSNGFNYFFLESLHLDKYVSNQFIFNMPWWDYWMLLIAFRHRLSIYFTNPTISHHNRHEINYQDGIWLRMGIHFTEFFDKKIATALQQMLEQSPRRAHRNLLKIVDSFAGEMNNYITNINLTLKTDTTADSTDIINKAKELINSGKISEAIDFLTAEAVDSNDAILFNYLGEAHWRSGDLENTLNYYSKAYELAPDNIDILQNVCDFLISIGQKENAEKLYMQFEQQQAMDDNNFDYFEILDENAEAEKDEYDYMQILEQQIEKDHEEKPLVSAIISTYNSSKFIGRCIENLLEQTIADKIEIVVVDSNSEENEGEIVKQYQQNHKNIIYLRTEQREPIYQAWNRAIKLSSGKYITNANTDDQRRGDALEIMARALDENPNATIVYADSYITENEEDTFENNTAKLRYEWPDYNLGTALSNFIYGPHPMWRNSLHKEIGCFPEDLTIAGDYDFYLRCSHAGEALHIREILGLYLQRPESLSGLFNSQNTKDETYEVLRKYRVEIPLEDIYPKLKDYKDDPLAKAAAMWDFGNMCAQSPYHDFEMAVKQYENVLNMEELPPQYKYRAQQMLLNNAGIIMSCGGNLLEGKKLFNQAGNLKEASDNKQIIQLLDQYNEKLFPVFFIFSEFPHDVVNTARLAYGLKLDDKGNLIKTDKHIQLFTDVYLGTNGIEIKNKIDEKVNTKSDDEIDVEPQTQVNETHKKINKRILFTMFGWDEPGGGTILPKTTAKRLAEKGYDVAVFYAGLNHPTNPMPYLYEKKEDSGVKLYGIYNRTSNFLVESEPELEINDPKIVSKFTELLDEFKPDVVHFQNFLGLSFAIADETKKRNIPTIYTPHNYHFIDPVLYMIKPELKVWSNTNFFENSTLVNNYPEKAKAYKERQDKAKDLLRNKIDLTLAISSRVKEILVDFGGQADKIAVVHQIPHSTELITRRSSFETHSPLRFAYLGSIIPHKGVHKIIIASRQVQNAEFLIYGDANQTYLTELKKISGDNVKWMGAYTENDLSEIAENTDGIIVPSVWEEGAGLVIMEAFKMGLPVIGARIGGIPDFIKEGKNGLLYPYNSGDYLAAMLRGLIAEPNQISSMMQNCSLPYNFDDFVSHLEKLYMKLSSNENIDISTANLIFKEKIND